ncbi:acyl-CoA synthetase (AMP-forming)/AMP-acid ligase II [Beggiatoa alba B18LD]|uniref:Acyl-CoA synthetase (AMP-forming)/AMP-acid ligase II n=1 Tax=Beggiatoa alba B18LD TaxID=395493 RepID=I3CDI1_9GAMM|nr:fatty acid--CoA ligase family protein [Beggiatoa alba]EIJ41674.1 acyl-CoA synthetase (AMP-forming)/AMP-acid ligase II [Beggiatoa alba B18LD]
MGLLTHLEKPSVATNTISDGQVTCTYHDIPLIFEKLEHFFKKHKITPETGIAIEFSNETFSVLTLLYLIRQGYCFFIYPPHPHRPAPPAFCRYHLHIQNTRDTTQDSPPEQFLTLSPNPHATTTTAPLEQERLYLRTSGSMGMAKIVEYHHKALLANAEQCVDRFQLTATDNVFLPVPIFHMYGLGAGLLPALSANANIALQDKTNIFRYLAVDKQFKPNSVFLTPTLCQLLVKGCQTPRHYRLIVSAGDKMPKTLFTAVEEKFGLLVNLYGSTEMGAVATSWLSDPLEKRASGYLRPLPSITASVPEPATHSPPSENSTTGELHLQYSYGFNRYVDEYAQGLSNAEQGQRGFKTGDLASFYPDDYLVIWGRCDHSINRRGYLVIFAEIEKAIESLTGIEKAVIVPIEQENAQGQGICAYCTLAAENTFTPQQIRDSCFTILPNYAVPDEINILTTMPLLPSGKVDRQALMQQSKLAVISP